MSAPETIATPEPTVLRKTCRCGNAVEHEIPPDITGRWFTFLERLTVSCAACAKAEDELERRQEAIIARGDMVGRRARSGLPHELWDLRFEDLDDRDRPAGAVSAAQRWAQRELRGLLYVGPVGTGKTRIAATAAQARLYGENVTWLSAPQLIAAIGRPMGSSERSEALNAIASSRRTLVLDDLDKLRGTEYAAEQLFLAIDGRVNAGAGLLVTMNLEPHELDSKWPAPFGEAIGSRLANYCEGYIIRGGDRRI